MPIAFIWVGILSGLLAGTLVNYISDVFPWKRNFVQPFCQKCQTPTRWKNYLLGKRCTHCQAVRPTRTWVVFLFFVVALSYFWLRPSLHLGFVVGFVLLVFFGVIFVIDFEHRLVLHQVSIFGAILSLSIGIWLHGIWLTLLGGAIGFGIMLVLYYLGEVYARWIARRRGQVLDEVALGFGDVNLSGIIGLLLGWPGVIAGVFTAIILGGVFSLLYLLALVISRNYKPFAAIPYAPFLVISASLYLYFL